MFSMAARCVFFALCAVIFLSLLNESLSVGTKNWFGFNQGVKRQRSMKRQGPLKRIFSSGVPLEEVEGRVPVHVVLINGEIINCDDLVKGELETALELTKRCLDKSGRNPKRIKVGDLNWEKKNPETRMFEHQKKIHEIDRLSDTNFEDQRLATVEKITVVVGCIYSLKGKREKDETVVQIDFWTSLTKLKEACQKRAADTGAGDVSMTPYARLLSHKTGKTIEIISTEGEEGEEGRALPSAATLLLANKDSYLVFRDTNSDN